MTNRRTSSARRISIEEDRSALEESLGQRFAEIAELTRLLAEAEQEKERLEAHVHWLHEILASIRRGFRWKLLNRWQDTSLLSRLKRKRLFDGDAYLAANPDVARAGMDPLQHYLSHGLREGRPLG